MALRTIVKDGDPILKKVCRPVTKFDDRLATLLDDMQDTPVSYTHLTLRYVGVFSSSGKTHSAA